MLSELLDLYNQHLTKLIIQANSSQFATIYVYVYMYICIHVCGYTYICVYIYIYTLNKHTYFTTWCVLLLLSVCLNPEIVARSSGYVEWPRRTEHSAAAYNICIISLYLSLSLYIYTYIYEYIYIYTCIWMCIYIYIHIEIYRCVTTVY